MNYLRNTFFVKGLIACFLLVAAQGVQAQNFDYQVLKNLSQRRSPADNKFNLFVSKTAPYISVGVPILMYGVGLIKKDKPLQQQSLQIGVAVAATVVETYALKYIINRPRPYKTYPDLMPIDSEDTPSFPSGHTSSAFGLATSLSINYPKWYVIVPSMAWASLTGYSRMYEGVHYPTDVLAGAAIGAGTAWLTWKANKAWQKRR